MVDLMERLRQELKGMIPEQHRRENILRSLSEDPEIWSALPAGNGSAYRLALRKAVEL